MREGVKRETEKGRKRNLKTEPDDDDTERRSCIRGKNREGSDWRRDEESQRRDGFNSSLPCKACCLYQKPPSQEKMGWRWRGRGRKKRRRMHKKKRMEILLKNRAGVLFFWGYNLYSFNFHQIYSWREKEREREEEEEYREEEEEEEERDEKSELRDYVSWLKQ